MPEPIRILHLITTTNTGGAEMMLAKLVASMDKESFQNRVVSMVHSGPVAQKIIDSGVPCESLGLDLGRPRLFPVIKLMKIIREYKPHVVQTWLYHADLLGLIATRMCSRAKIAWNIRCSLIDFSQYGKLTALTVRACTWLSPFPDAVIANSYSGKAFHENMGYKPQRFEVLPNGFNLARFSHAPERGDLIRQELGIPLDAPCFTMVARYDPMKDHDTLLRSLARVHQKFPEAHLILCGDQIDSQNQPLTDTIKNLNLGQHVHLLGRRSDIPDILNASDVLVLSSFGEGFPNVVGEAMACQVPVIATDVGDIAEVVGDKGLLVPVQDPVQMSAAMETILSLPPQERTAMGVEARNRIFRLYSMESVVSRYEKFYRGLPK